MLCLAVPPIMLHNLSLNAILFDAVLHLGNKFDLIRFDSARVAAASISELDCIPAAHGG